MYAQKSLSEESALDDPSIFDCGVDRRNDRVGWSAYVLWKSAGVRDSTAAIISNARVRPEIPDCAGAIPVIHYTDHATK